MTLCQTIIGPSGLWTCADHRLTSLPGQTILDDDAPKLITIRCPHGAGMLTYSGLGKVGTEHVSEWLLAWLRGETRSLADTVSAVKSLANSKLAKVCFAYGIMHTFMLSAVEHGNRWIVVVSNERADGSVGSTFTAAGSKLDGNSLRVYLAGCRAAIPARDMETFRDIQARSPWPRSSEDFRKLLVKVNQRSSQHPFFRKFISASCVVGYMSIDGEMPVAPQEHGRDPALPPRVQLSIFRGIDMSMIMGTMVQNRELRRTAGLSQAESRLRLEEAIRRAIDGRGAIPGNG